MQVFPIISNRYSVNKNVSSRSNNQPAFKANPFTVQEFRAIGNKLCTQLEGVMPGFNHEPKDVKIIDELKELLLNTEDIKFIDENDKRMHLLLKQKAKKLETSETQESNQSFFYL